MTCTFTYKTLLRVYIKFSNNYYYDFIFHNTDIEVGRKYQKSSVVNCMLEKQEKTTALAKPKLKHPKLLSN